MHYLRSTYHHGNLRAALTQAALELARGGGPATVTVRGAARRVGVTPPAAYRHFATHDELLAVVKDCVLALLAERLDDHADVANTDSDTVPDRPAVALAGLRAVAEAYTAFARELPGLFAMVCHGSVDTVQTLVAERFGRHLDALATAGAVAPDRRPGADLALWSAAHGLAVLMVDGPLRSAPEADQCASLAQVLEVVLAGLAGQAAATGTSKP